MLRPLAQSFCHFPRNRSGLRGSKGAGANGEYASRLLGWDGRGDYLSLFTMVERRVPVYAEWRMSSLLRSTKYGGGWVWGDVEGGLFATQNHSRSVCLGWWSTREERENGDAAKERRSDGAMC